MVKWESFQWLLTVATVLKDVAEMIGKAHGAIPAEWAQKMPKLFGLTLDDERIFNAVLAQLTPDEQIIITRFLKENCEDFERNRFINIVSGMEVIPGKPGDCQTKFAADGKTVTETNHKGGSPGIDYRKNFLEKFADVIKNQFRGDMKKAYDYCVAGRMIIPNPMHQKALNLFSDSVKQFKTLVLKPFGANSLEELVKNVNAKGAGGIAEINNGMGTLIERARAWRDKK